MGLDYTTFDELNVKELHTCFEYASSKGYKVLVCGGNSETGLQQLILIRLWVTMIDYWIVGEAYDYKVDF